MPSSSAPRTTVVIPTWNRERILRRCLAAVESTASCEVLVVDNGSEDGTRSAIEESGVASIRNERNEGFARACNQGAEAAKTPYVCFLNNDTEALPGWLASMEPHAENCVVGSTLIERKSGEIHHAGIGFEPFGISTKADGRFVQRYEFRARELKGVRMSGPAAAVTGACLLVRRDRFLDLGGFDERFRNGYEDVDFCLRAQHAGLPVWYERSAVLLHDRFGSGRKERDPYQRENARHLFERWGIS